uniref:Uncharacterized protein n=1 Tax=Arundo donax TaxID=35708 RepID=A0A0A8YLQ0_ARUDO
MYTKNSTTNSSSNSLGTETLKNTRQSKDYQKPENFGTIKNSAEIRCP